TIGRDRRLVLVNPAPATVAVSADADEYQPGQTAHLDIAVTHADEAMPGVVGVSIVDESVFELGGQEAGFARTYFLLERARQQPRYQIRGFSHLEDDDPSPYDRNTASAQNALAGYFAQELAFSAPDRGAV